MAEWHTTAQLTAATQGQHLSLLCRPLTAAVHVISSSWLIFLMSQRAQEQEGGRAAVGGGLLPATPLHLVFTALHDGIHDSAMHLGRVLLGNAHHGHPWGPSGIDAHCKISVFPHSSLFVHFWQLWPLLSPLVSTRFFPQTFVFPQVSPSVPPFLQWGKAQEYVASLRVIQA